MNNHHHVGNFLTRAISASRGRVVLLLLAATLGVTSCVRELGGPGSIPAAGQQLSLPVNLPRAATVNTRGMTAAREQKLAEIDVLAFDNASGHYLYRSAGEVSAINTTEGTATIRFTARPRAAAQKFVIIANARAQVTTAVGSFTEEDEKEAGDLLPGLLASVSGPGYRWPTGDDATIPMWGETGELVITSTPASLPATTLLRALARVTVTVDDATRAKFTLSSVRLYNTNTAGRVVPDAGNLEAMKATAPTLPGNPGERAGAENATLYNETTDFTVAGVSMLNAIYTFEREATAMYPVTLVVGGKYDGSGTETYYKIVLATGATFTPVDLLRNHSYNVTITGVDKEGWTTPELAYDNQPENMEATILPWDDNDYGEITFDKFHSLAVNKSLFEFHAGGGTDILEILTDYDGTPDGWRIHEEDESNLPEWLELSSTSGASNVQGEVSITVYENATEESRLYTFRVVAGNLEKVITVTQSDETPFGIYITDENGKPVSELLFGPGDQGSMTYPEPQKFRVRWSPTSLQPTASAATLVGIDPFPYYEDAGGMELTTPDSPLDAGGTMEYTVQPEYMGSGTLDKTVKASRLDFTLEREGEYRNASIYLRQVMPILDIEGVISAGYDADASKLYSFTIKSVPGWTLTNVVDDDNILVPGSYSTAGGPSSEGQPFKFRLNTRVSSTDDPESATATLTFKSTAGTLEKTVTIKSNYICLQVTDIPTAVYNNTKLVNITFSPYPEPYSIKLIYSSTTLKQLNGLNGKGPHKFTWTTNTGYLVRTVNVIHVETNKVVKTFDIVPVEPFLNPTTGYSTSCPIGTEVFKVEKLNDIRSVLITFNGSIANGQYDINFHYYNSSGVYSYAHVADGYMVSGYITGGSLNGGGLTRTGSRKVCAYYIE
jgi:hypothetical protein